MAHAGAAVQGRLRELSAVAAKALRVYGFSIFYTLRIGRATRTNIDIDDALLSRAMTATGLTTKRATVEEGLRLLVRMHGQMSAIDDLEGLGWDGDLDEMRQGRLPGRS